ncbi:hypothetical protein BZG36_02481 [Bifiguratus adelaidae]|uniref:Sugar phosphate phosphatase n=1 Tax=Bifiguratus adelaidae TaxID=1938954 RepID=A0A261Y0V7_9FUNG|nr:hypothetical protein BZG36_02481 [Bifiguratus adelaidae]
MAEITPANPPKPAYVGAEKDTFAFVTVAKRWPVIVTNVIDDVYKSYHQGEGGKHEQEAKQIIEQISALKYDIQRDKELRPIQEDGYGDVAQWNQLLETYFKGKTWFTASWLFTECYMYRRIREVFQLTETWKDYDPFFRQKTSTFRGSSAAVFELAAKFAEPIRQQSDDEKRVWFHELAQVSLWGNATDLSLLANMKEEDIKSVQAMGQAKLEEQEKMIVVNDLDKIWNKVKTLQSGRVDFVLDNAGFELYVDLVFADYLLQANCASQIYFHCKTIPWFVSDTMPSDFQWLIDTCLSDFFNQVEPAPSAEQTENLKTLARRWQQYMKEGKFVVKSDPFWCTGLAYRHLKAEAPDLFTDMAQKADLVIFKGDLNFRKLTYDCHWPVTTSFKEAIGPVMADEFGSLCVFRTNKADVVVGLKEGKEEELLEAGFEDWRYSGKFAVVEFSQGRGKAVIDTD